MKICPLIKDACLEHGCEFYTHLTGLNPQTGVAQDEWACAIKWIPLLLVENADQTRKAAASTDKVATEVRNHHATFIGCLPEDLKKRLSDADPRLQKIPTGNGNSGSIKNGT